MGVYVCECVCVYICMDVSWPSGGGNFVLAFAAALVARVNCLSAPSNLSFKEKLYFSLFLVDKTLSGIGNWRCMYVYASM